MCEIYSKLTLKALGDVMNIFLVAFYFSTNFILCPDIVIEFDIGARAVGGAGWGGVDPTQKMKFFGQKIDAIRAKINHTIFICT